MPARLARALEATVTAFPLAADSARATAILEDALAALVNGEARLVRRARVDALGAPLAVAEDWQALRLAARQLVSEIGLAEAAERYGCAPDSLADLIYRTRAPGPGRQARLLQLVKSTG